MRDLFVVGLVVVGCLAALRRPWIGIMVWVWISIMNPHRYSWGFAYSAPLAAMTAGSVLIGLLATRERDSPFKGPPVAWLAAFTLWITASWLLGLDVARDYGQWNKVMKIFLMTFVSLALLRTKQHILALVWVCGGSLLLLGGKGGLFTVLTGGNYRVWGPPDSFISNNNEFALALIMTVPLLRFLQLQLEPGWKRHAMLVGLLLCVASAVGSHSRGALVALVAMGAMFWWRGRNKFVLAIVILALGLAVLSFLPEHWFERMRTIGNYEEDRSALGRISAWWTAWGIAKTYVFGVGFNTATPALFARFSPYPEFVHAAHSIYFQAMGNHGFIGLFLFCAVFVSTYRLAGRLRRAAAGIPQAAWCVDLGAMVQVALVGYAVGGAFLSLTYFDLPYYMMVAIVLANVWVSRQAWKTEPVYPRRWYTVPGLATAPAGPPR